MILTDLATAAMVAAVLTVLVGYAFRGVRGMRLLAYFGLLVLATWALGAWLPRARLPFVATPVVGFVVAGLAVSLLLGAMMPGGRVPRDGRVFSRRETLQAVREEANRRAFIGSNKLLLIVLVLALGAAVVLRYASFSADRL